MCIKSNMTTINKRNVRYKNIDNKLCRMIAMHVSASTDEDLSQSEIAVNNFINTKWTM